MKAKRLFMFRDAYFACTFAAILMASAAGCVSPDPAKEIKTFSEATVLTADNVTQGFKLVENTRFKEEVSTAVLHYDQNVGFNPKDIQPFMGTNAVAVRLAVLDGLKSYAANLSALMGNSALSNLDQQTTALGKTLNKLNTNLVNDAFFKTAPATSQELQIFTTAINALGHWLINRQQQKDAKQVIGLMQQPVADICQLLHKDFEILGQQLENDYNQTLSNENQYILNNLAHFGDTPGEKRAEIQHMAELTQEMQNDTAIFVAMDSSATRLAAAHKALGELFTKDKANVKSLINNLSTESQRIAKYYSSLNSTN